jgi:hypothetical protein
LFKKLIKAMKIQMLGRSPKACPLVPTVSVMPPFLAFSMWVPLLPANEDVWLAAYLDYRQNRENGTEIDNPKRPFPGRRGTYYWEEDRSLRNSHGYKYWDRAYYYASSDDEDWLREKDQRYLARIEQEGKLKELEPAIWYLREKGHVTNIAIEDW